MVNEGTTFKEDSEYQSDQKLSMKEIVLRHIRKIGDICCQEFTGGFWEKKPVKTQSGVMFTEVYHEDIREVYCNAMDFLIDIIYPMGDDDLRTILQGDKEYKSDEIKEKLIAKRKIFKEINKMFNRTNFWQGTDAVEE